MSSKSNLNPIKRILTLVLAVAMVFSDCSCRGGKTDKGDLIGLCKWRH